MPAWDQRFFDVELAASSQDYCDEITGMLAGHGLVISELTTHIFGQLLAVHPAYDAMFDTFAPAPVRGNPAARTEWARRNLLLAARASRRLGLTEMGTFSGSFAWPYLFPFPQRPEGLIETAFDELARRWLPVLDACDEQDVNLCFEIHPSEDLHDGISFEMFHERVAGHARCGILFDPSHFAAAAQLPGLPGHLQGPHPHVPCEGRRVQSDRTPGHLWRLSILGRPRRPLPLAGRWPGGFQVHLLQLTQHGYQGWAALEWECCLKDQEAGAREGAAFIKQHIIPVTDKVFDDFAGAAISQADQRAAGHRLSGQEHRP